MPTLWIAGDSTASIKLKEKRPESGWGEYLQTFISPLITIENCAVNGRSTKSYIDEGHLKAIDQRIKKDDFLIIQFGHNDGKIEDPNRYTDPDKDYLENLMRFVRVALKHDATPILMTSITRRTYIGKNLKEHTISSYPNAMKKLAQKEHVFLIDAYQITHDLVNQLGEEKSKKLYLHLDKGMHENYPDGVVDNTHLSPYGAKLFASIIAIELNKII